LTKYRLKCTGNLEVVRGTKTGTSITYSATAIADTTDILPDDATNLYFARAKSAGTGIDKVTLYKVVNGTETEIESTAFEARQTLSGWIVPSGWKIEGSSITTPMPVTGAFGPQTVGSGLLDTAYAGKPGDVEPSNPKGEAFTANLFPNGFVLELTVTFQRNTTPGYTDGGKQYSFITGYVQPDFEKSEKLGDQKRHQMDFVGNSGIRFCGKEIQLFDIRALQTGLNIVQANLTQKDPDPPQSPWLINYIPQGGIDYGKNGILDGRTQVCNVITGNVYNDQRITPVGDTPQQVYQKFSEALARQPGVSYELEVSVTVVGNQLNITTKLKNSTETIFSNSVDTAPNPYTKDKRVYLQAHWGSGIKFSSIDLQ
jgi:hypothetical protein